MTPNFNLKELKPWLKRYNQLPEALHIAFQLLTPRLKPRLIRYYEQFQLSLPLKYRNDIHVFHWIIWNKIKLQTLISWNFQSCLLCYQFGKNLTLTFDPIPIQQDDDSTIFECSLTTSERRFLQLHMMYIRSVRQQNFIDELHRIRAKYGPPFYPQEPQYYMCWSQKVLVYEASSPITKVDDPIDIGLQALSSLKAIHQAGDFRQIYCNDITVSTRPCNLRRYLRPIGKLFDQRSWTLVREYLCLVHTSMYKIIWTILFSIYTLRAISVKEFLRCSTTKDRYN